MRNNTFNRPSPFASLAIWMLCSLYTLFSVGIVKATHLCMGREESVSYFTSQPKKCPCSLFGNEKDNCCEDEHDLLKLEDSQKNLSSFALTVPALVCLGSIFNEDVATARTYTSSSMYISARDALPPPRPLFEIHCSYVFYDDKSLA